MKNEFDNDVKYKLYRSVHEILHPTISKKNISDYRIIIDEGILPVRIFYPKKITGINKVILYIHGNGKITSSEGKYANICRKMVKRCECILIAIDYPKKKDNIEVLYQSVYDTIKFIFKELERNDISSNNIILMGDSTGANMITGINYLNKEEINIKNEVLFYPVLDVKKYLSESNDIAFYYHKKIKDNEKLKEDLLNPLINNIIPPNTLVLVGNGDKLKDECREYAKIYKSVDCTILPFSEHGFLNSMDNDLEEEIKIELTKFLGKYTE